MTHSQSPFFAFSALNAQGRLVTGYVRAENRRQARKLLRVQHPDLLAVRRCWVWPWQTQKMRQEVLLFLSALTSLTSAGLRVVDSLDILSAQWQGTGRQKIQTIRRALENGLGVDEAFALAWPFDRACHGLLQAGQETGDLHNALSQIHIHLYSQRAKVGSCQIGSKLSVFEEILCESRPLILRQAEFQQMGEYWCAPVVPYVRSE
jgi:type II secretory pathway component PulF